MAAAAVDTLEGVVEAARTGGGGSEREVKDDIGGADGSPAEVEADG